MQYDGEMGQGGPCDYCVHSCTGLMWVIWQRELGQDHVRTVSQLFEELRKVYAGT